MQVGASVFRVGTSPGPITKRLCLEPTARPVNTPETEARCAQGAENRGAGAVSPAFPRRRPVRRPDGAGRYRSWNQRSSVPHPRPTPGGQPHGFCVFVGVARAWVAPGLEPKGPLKTQGWGAGATRARALCPAPCWSPQPCTLHPIQQSPLHTTSRVRRVPVEGGAPDEEVPSVRLGRDPRAIGTAHEGFVWICLGCRFDSSEPCCLPSVGTRKVQPCHLVTRDRPRGSPRPAV